MNSVECWLTLALDHWGMNRSHLNCFWSIFLPIYNALSVFSMTAYVTYKKSPSRIETLQSFSSFVSAKVDITTYLFLRLWLKRNQEYTIEGHPKVLFWPKVTVYISIKFPLTEIQSENPWMCYRLRLCNFWVHIYQYKK